LEDEEEYEGGESDKEGDKNNISKPCNLIF